MPKKSTSSLVRRILPRPLASSSLSSGTMGNNFCSMAHGQNFTAAYIATSMNAIPMMGLMTVEKTWKSPPKLKRMLKRTKDRMSSTKAAVMMACPKFSCKTPASPNKRNEMPTLVGANAVPAEMPSGTNCLPKAITNKEPAMRGKIVPTTATTQAGRPTWRAFAKSKCMPLSKIINATPAWPMRVKTSGVRLQWWETSASQLLSKHCA
mmetsp:Transcript_98141/g.219901  ORF Transcript_98141/g.219901 Transcript_98141/m.219901 type:complete len:208 (-) Transcript_98141:1057-1680(-)